MASTPPRSLRARTAPRGGGGRGVVPALKPNNEGGFGAYAVSRPKHVSSPRMSPRMMAARTMSSIPQSPRMMSSTRRPPPRSPAPRKAKKPTVSDLLHGEGSSQAIRVRHEARAMVTEVAYDAEQLAKICEGMALRCDNDVGLINLDVFNTGVQNVLGMIDMRYRNRLFALLDVTGCGAVDFRYFLWEALRVLGDVPGREKAKCLFALFAADKKTMPVARLRGILERGAGYTCEYMDYARKLLELIEGSKNDKLTRPEIEVANKREPLLMEALGRYLGPDSATVKLVNAMMKQSHHANATPMQLMGAGPPIDDSPFDWKRLRELWAFTEKEWSDNPKLHATRTISKAEWVVLAARFLSPGEHKEAPERQHTLEALYDRADPMRGESGRLELEQLFLCVAKGVKAGLEPRLAFFFKIHDCGDYVLPGNPTFVDVAVLQYAADRAGDFVRDCRDAIRAWCDHAPETVALSSLQRALDSPELEMAFAIAM